MSAMAVSPLTGELFKGSCMGTWIFPPPYAGDTPVYDKATVRPFDTDAGAGQIQALPDMSALPTDPDRDGIYEDLNGNGRKDFDDVVLFFKQLDWIAANEPVSAFDPNGNGRADFDDIVRMFKELMTMMTHNLIRYSGIIFMLMFAAAGVQARHDQRGPDLPAGPCLECTG